VVETMIAASAIKRIVVFNVNFILSSGKFCPPQERPPPRKSSRYRLMSAT
jgi:hypothetical protein